MEKALNVKKEKTLTWYWCECPGCYKSHHLTVFSDDTVNRSYKCHHCGCNFKLEVE